MTNEEIVEEIYFEAHTEGFIEELLSKTKELSFTHPKLTYHERVEKAYYTIKKNS
jgi:hypothetical protein